MPNLSVSPIGGAEQAIAITANKASNKEVDFDTYLTNNKIEKSEIVAGAKSSTSLNDIFERASKKYGVDVDLLKALGYEESRFQANAVSSAGAIGIMQLMPSTAKSLGVKNPYDPEQNIMGGAKLLAAHLKKYNGNITLALAAYGAGSNAVDKYGGVPPYKETQTAIKRVLNYYYNGLGADEKLADKIKIDSNSHSYATKAPNANEPLLTDISEESRSVLTKADIKRIKRDMEVDKMLEHVADRDIYLTSNMETDMIGGAVSSTPANESTATVSKSNSGYTYEDYLDFVDDYVDIVANMSNKSSSTSNTDSLSSTLGSLYNTGQSSDNTSILNVLQSTLANMAKNQK